MSKKEKPELTKEDLALHKIQLFLQTMDNYGNDAMLYLDRHFKWLMENMDKDDEDNWGIFTTFTYNFTHMMQTYRDLGNYIIDGGTSSLEEAKDVKEEANTKKEKEMN